MSRVKTALVTLADGFEEIEATTIIDVLRRGDVQAITASVQRQTVVGAHGISMNVEHLIQDCEHQTYDAIVLPGGLPGAEHLRDSRPLKHMLQLQKDQGRLIGAICASPAIVLHSHGLLNRVKATAYPGLAERLDPQWREDKAVVVDQNIVTSQGPATAMAFALTLVKILHGSEKAKNVADQLLTSAPH